MILRNVGEESILGALWAPYLSLEHVMELILSYNVLLATHKCNSDINILTLE